MSGLYGTEPKTISNAKDNKITINIDTDDNKPVYPRITIQENGIVVPIDSGVEYSILSDMVPNTVYSNGVNCYWKTDAGEITKRDSKEKPDYNWTVIQVDHDYTDADTWESNKLYYNPNSQTYFWLDPYAFHSDSADNLPNLKTTSVRFTNKHTDFFNNSKIYGATIVKNNASGERIVVDGANKLISSSSTKRIFGDDFNWIWLELYDGKNEITIEGNCTVTLEWREVRKVGEY
jgi:hypothetical protein